MQLVGVRGQYALDHLYDASGTITAGGTSQRLLPQQKSRSYLMIVNNSSGALYVDFGGARATAALTNGVVTSFSVPNAGQGYTLPPKVHCYGGGPPERNTLAGLSATDPTWPSPSNFAHGVVTLSGGAVASIAVSNGGAGYLQAPFVFLENASGDANGVVLASTSSIPLLTQGSALIFDASNCPTDAVAIFGASTSQAFICKFMY